VSAQGDRCGGSVQTGLPLKNYNIFFKNITDFFICQVHVYRGGRSHEDLLLRPGRHRHRTCRRLQAAAQEGQAQETQRGRREERARRHLRSAIGLIQRPSCLSIKLIQNKVDTTTRLNQYQVDSQQSCFNIN
jgi:hypothetical protein